MLKQKRNEYPLLLEIPLLGPLGHLFAGRIPPPALRLRHFIDSWHFIRGHRKQPNY